MTVSAPADATPELPIADESTSIVVRGPFNPAVFSPSWFRSAGLIGESEFADAQIDVITAEFASFRMGWLQFTATTETLQLLTMAVEERPRLRDAMVGALGVLNQHPIAAMGVNTDSHTVVSSPAVLHHVGDTLAPKAVWGDFLEFPGVRNMLMWGARTDGWYGRLNVQVEPSQRHRPGLYVAVNDHFDLERVEDPFRSRDAAYEKADVPFPATNEKRIDAIEILNSDWSEIMQRSAAAHGRIRALAQEAS